MKPSLAAWLCFTRTLTVDEARCISFMGRENMVYATPRMVSDVEYACREFLFAHLDEGEDSVGAHVTIDHLGPTPLGMKATIEAKLSEVDRRKLTFSFTVRDALDEVGRGVHVRFVVESARTRERVAAKRARAGLA